MSRNRNRYNMTIILPCQLNISFSERTITIMHPRFPPSGKMHYGRFLKSGTQIIQPSLLNIEFGKKEKIHQIPTNRKKFLFIVKQSIKYILIMQLYFIEVLRNIFLTIAVRLNSTTIKIVCSTADFPRSSIFFSFPSPP